MKKTLNFEKKKRKKNQLCSTKYLKAPKCLSLPCATTRTSSQLTSLLFTARLHFTNDPPKRLPWSSLLPHPGPSRGSPPRWWPPPSAGTRRRWGGAWGTSCPPRSLRSPAPWRSGSGSSGRRRRCCPWSWKTPGRTPCRARGAGRAEAEGGGWRDPGGRRELRQSEEWVREWELDVTAWW